MIGVDPLEQFLVETSPGRWQVPDTAWDPAKKEWFSTVPDVRKPGEFGHWTGRGLTWNSRCAACHDTFVEKRYDAAADRYDTRVAETGVGCESCHGPSAAHAAGGPPPAPIGIDACAACHSLRAELVDGIEPSKPFLDQFAPSFAGLGDEWYPDGQVHGEVFEWASFAGAPMYAAGVRCTDCHDPHSGKLAAEGNTLCLRCHGTGPEAGLAHSHHRDGSPGQACVGCHMPETTYMQRHPRRDHGFTLPDPVTAHQVGAPDACTRCHPDKPPEWSEKLATAWYGDIPHRERTLAVARARAGDDRGRDGALDLARGSSAPRWRATGASILAAWIEDPEVRSALQALTVDPEPLVRFAAIEALAPAAAQDPASARAIDAALQDPVRAVRVAAERNAAPPLQPADPRGAEWREYLDHNLDQPSARLERGGWLLSVGAPGGLDDLRRAAEWDPSSAEPHRAYAVALAGAGKTEEAWNELVAATDADPKDPQAWFFRGLQAASLHDVDDARSSLERAVSLDPKLARAWLNLGLLRSQSGDLRGSLDALSRADAADPSSPDALFARAAVLRDAGRTAEAVAAANALLARFPAHQQGRALLQSLGEQPK